MEGIEGRRLHCSVVVPVYNGARSIERCLNALAAQSISSTLYEIIVVDDGSVDDTVHLVEQWASVHTEVQVQLVGQANAGPAAARNHGAQHVGAPIILFTDVDCAPMPYWIDALIQVFDDPDVAGAKGAYLTDQGGLVPRFVQAEYEDRYDRMLGQQQIDFVDTYSAAYRCDIFLENGGFDPIFTTASVEDQEFSFRLAQKGYRLVFAPRAHVRHIHDTDAFEYARRKYFIGFWKALLARWYPERMVHDSHTPQVLKVQIVLCAFLIVLAPLAVLGMIWPQIGWAIWLFAGVVVLFLASTLPFLRKLAQKSWLLVLVGPAMLVVRAAALGSGFVMGTVHFTGKVPVER